MPRFTRIRRLRQAGQGDVWESLDATTEAVVAQKFLTLSGRRELDDVARRRFEREVRSQSGLVDAAVMPIIDFDFAADPPWYAMPLASGSLADRLATHTPMSGAELGGLARSVFAALELAHRRGVVHRDLKPGNILRLDGPGRPEWVVADFGLCRDVRSESADLTTSGTELGTTRYMAPEQAEDPHGAGFEADVFALGCVLHHCLTGEPPGTRQIDYDRLPPAYRPVIEKATALHPHRRHTSVGEFRAEFEAVSGHGATVTGAVAFEVRAARARLAAIADSHVDLNDLPRDAFRGFAEDLASALEYRVIERSGVGHASFYVEDAERGVGPVVALQRRFRVPTADLINTQAAMGRHQSGFALFVTTGRLSPEAARFAAADKKIVVIDGPGLALHLDYHRAAASSAGTAAAAARSAAG